MVKKCPLKPAPFGSLLEQQSDVCGWEEVCVRWPSCTGNANTALESTGSSTIGGSSPAITSGGKYCDAGALLLTSERGERGETPFLLLPSLLLQHTDFFLLVISPVQADCWQGSGKRVGTQKGSILRQRLCGLLCPSSLPNSSPSPAAFPWESCSALSALSPTSITSPCSRADEFLSLTRATQAIARCLSQGGKAEQGS